MRRFQITIGQVMIVIAVCAVGLWSPKIILFASAATFWWVFIVGALYSRTVRRVAQWCMVLVVLLILIAICQPAVVTKRRRGAAPPPTPALPQTTTAATAAGQSIPLRGEPGR